ncbi:hypothetical protein RCIA177 [Methanocella arvoryzae MRE50]|uniref:Uncharacterized protein n=1 Tax=Methanocella arvoryzae (strain DSM 22066 / NBRC 105507 / MRE50) TaxID=351160 RepID=Q0W295_METAR|nr:hypothetical protein RCIA177 [Methanocella arvoryzae MRE50]
MLLFLNFGRFTETCSHIVHDQIRSLSRMGTRDGFTEMSFLAAKLAKRPRPPRNMGDTKSSNQLFIRLGGLGSLADLAVFSTNAGQTFNFS